MKKFCLSGIFETGVHYVAQAGPKLMILLSQLSEYQDYGQVPPGLVVSCLSHSFVQLCSGGPQEVSRASLGLLSRPEQLWRSGSRSEPTHRVGPHRSVC